MRESALLPLAGLTICSAALAAPGYELTPRVLPVGAEVSLSVRATGDARLDDGRDYRVQIRPMEWQGEGRVAEAASLRARPTAGVLHFSARFDAEQEYVLELLPADQNQPLATLRAYAVAPDLFVRRPYKGDVHQHSNRSDGKEEPGYVAGFNRKIGMDFMALTDHRQYAPSLEAIRAFEGVPVDLRIYPGEEVHPPDTMVHIVNFGGRFSVNELFKTPAYSQEVARIARSLRRLPPGIDPKAYAACRWAFAKIREAGGIGIFCHPYWVTGNRYNVPEALIDRLFADRPFDAFELLGGFWLNETESNALQVARYYQEAARGRRVNVVGVSDGHGTARGLHGWYYTIVLARSPEFADLREGITGGYSVAVERLPNAPAARPYGPFRLVKYCSFLLREVLPAHDALCAEEGDLMLAHVAGDAAAAEKLRGLQGRVADLYNRVWARTGE